MLPLGTATAPEESQESTAGAWVDTTSPIRGGVLVPAKHQLSALLTRDKSFFWPFGCQESLPASYCANITNETTRHEYLIPSSGLWSLYKTDCSCLSTMLCWWSRALGHGPCRPRRGFYQKDCTLKLALGCVGSTQMFLQLEVLWLWMLPTVFKRQILGLYGQGCEAGLVILAVTVCTLRWPVWGSGLWLERVLITCMIMMKRLVED